MTGFHGIIFNFTSFDSLDPPRFHARKSGGHRIATFLRKLGWNIEVLDWPDYWTETQLKNFCQKKISQQTKFVGLSLLFTSYIQWAKKEEICRIVKDINSDIKIISGAAEVLIGVQTKMLDWHIKGYGEKALIKLLEYLFSNGPCPKYFLKDGIKTINANQSYIYAPCPDPVIEYENRDFIHHNEWLSIEFSRGCKFSCKFCNYPLLGVKGDYTRTAESFRHQIKNTFDKFGVKNYVVSDETFNDSTDKIRKYANVVDRLDFTPFFSGFLRADLMTVREQDKEELLRMNFLGHYYGVETFNESAGKAIGKGLDPERLKDGILKNREYFQSHGRQLYRATISLIAGLPFETKESLYQTESWLRQHWQNEFVSAFGLVIWNADMPGATESFLSKNWSNLGYIKTAEKEDKIVWKNQFMDSDWANNWGNRISEEWFASGDSYVDPWNLGQFFDMPVEEKISIKYKDINWNRTSVLIKDYIHKKVNS